MKRFLPVLFLSGGLFAADLGRGIQLYKDGKYSSAESELKGAIGSADKNAEAHRYLGLAYLEQKKFDDAERELKRAAELEPGSASKAAMARFYAEKQQYDKAQAELDKAGGANADYARGLIQLNAKQYSEAAKSIEAFLGEEPNNGYAHYYAGLAYNGMGRKDKMLSEFELFLRMMPDAPEARKVRAVMQTGR